MKFSRRDLLIGSSVFALTKAEAGINNPGSAGSSGPVAPTGKVNLGLTAPSLQQNSTPFINLWKGCNTNITYVQSGVNFRTDTPAGTTNFGEASAFPLFADSNCEPVTPLPAGTTKISRNIFQFSTPTGSNIVGQYPPQFAGQQFTVDWTGATDWTIAVQDSVRGTIAQGTSPFTFTWPTTYGFPTGGNVIIFINQNAGTLSNPPKGLRIYKTNFAVGGLTGAQRLALGQVIDPDYAASVASSCGTFRCMDWMATINDNVNNSFATFPTETSANWGGGGPSGIRGMPLSVIVKMALATNKNPHICIPSLFMCQKYKDIASITRATSPVVTTQGPHNWANGDTLILNSTGLFVLINPASYATSTFTTSAPHGMVNGYPLKLGTTNGQALDGSTYPTPIAKNTCYYACNVTGTTFQIATTQANAVAGTNIALSGSMTGTINLYLDMNFNQYTVSNSNPSGSTFQLTGPGSDTTILTSGSLNGGFSMSPYDLTYINTQVGLLAGYFRDNLPAPFCPTYEVDNEIWNFGTRVFFNFNGQSRGKFNDNVYQVVGYMQGVFAQAIKTAYAGDRSRYKAMFCGNQMFGDLFGAGLQGGWNAYVADNPSATPTGLFDYLLGNTYIGNVSYNNNGGVITCTFGTNTVAFSGNLAFNGNNPGLPIKLSTTGALPAGLTAGALGTAAATRSSSQIIGTISGNVLTVLANFGNGNSGGTILAGSTLALPGVIPAGTTIAAFGTGGTTGSGGSGTYQISSSLTVATATVFYCGTPYVPGTGPIYWLVGTGPNFGLATMPGGSPVSFTGPGSGVHSATRCPIDVVNFLMTQSLALNISTPGTYPTPYTYYNQEISNDLLDARWTAGGGSLDPLGLNFDFCIKSAINSYQYYYNTYLAPGKLLAGLSQTSYEGGNNNPPQTAPSSTTAGFLLENDPTWQAMHFAQTYCQGQADNFAAMDAGCRLVTGGFYKTSQFLDANPFSINAQGGIYGSKEYIGDTNVRWQGVVAVNNS